MNDNPIDESKSLGQYYTPEELATLMARNALTGSRQTVFDPSFGHGSLLCAAARVLRGLGNEKPEDNLFGVDVSEDARAFVTRSGIVSKGTSHLVTKDFLSVRPHELRSAPFDVILSNPPFTRHHHMKKSAKDNAIAAMREIGLELSGLSSHWAYFVLFSLAFLKKGGRFSILVPIALLDADYARGVREVLQGSFESIDIHLLKPDYFDSVQEHIILADAKGFAGIGKDPTGEVRVVINGFDGTVGNPSPKGQGWAVSAAVLSHESLSIMKDLAAHSSVTTLGSIAEIRIGVVTGGNDYFVMSKALVDDIGLTGNLVQPVLTRSRNLRGLSFGRPEWSKLVSEGGPAFLLDLHKETALPKKLRQYLNNDYSHIVRSRYHCRNRTPWYTIGMGKIPDAFLQYMTSSAPRIVLNDSPATCTNTIHRLSWRGEVTRGRKRLLAMGSLTSLFGLSAELLGRRLGGGLLKLEPGKASQVLMPMPDLKVERSTWDELDGYVRAGRHNEASAVADRTVLMDGLGMSEREVRALKHSRELLRSYRLNGRR